MTEVALRGFEHARVLVVDDNLPSAQLVQALLGRAGLHSVRAVTDSREVPARCAEMHPDLVLLDLHMPRVDGYTVLAELRRQLSAAELPVLVLTADTTRQATHLALELGANDFLAKPLDAAELVLRVRNLLHMHELHAGLRRRQRWLEASAQLARDLLSGACVQPLRRVCELAREAADADTADVVLPEDPSTPLGEPRLQEHSIAVPLVGSDTNHGTLLLARSPRRTPFTDGELTLAGSFAGQAAVAIEFAVARADQDRMLMLSDRHRIARDLHDHVIQRLFATGLRLQQLAARMGPGPDATRIEEHVDDLDETIAEIRSTIFELRQDVRTGADPVSARLAEVTAELTEVLGFEPLLRLDGPLDSVPETVTDDLIAAVREAITNVARHARARHAEIAVTVTGTEVILEVLDDGAGIGNAVRRSGLTNLAERANGHGGVCTVGEAPGGGTLILWTAPLRAELLSR